MKKAEYVSIDPEKPDIQVIKKAAAVLKKGGIIAFPTETVYGIFANARNKKAVERLYRIKKRPKDKPFAVLINKFSELKKFNVIISPAASKMLKKYWPGPLTAILKTKEGVAMGFRMPDYKAVLTLLEYTNAPLFASSANTSGEKECVDAEDILKNFKKEIDMIVDAGKSPLGMPSTVVDFTTIKPKIVREGVISREVLLTHGF
ncbi:MAG: L-threonylcarbamoyladenylate synthase [Candidatus Omnitrophota bacterium]